MSQSDSFRTIVADPPWPFAWSGHSGGRRRRCTTLGYEVMPYGRIAAIPVWRLVDIHATLFLWVTQDALHGGWAQAIAADWGFEHRVGEIVWRKPNFGMGAFPRMGHEVCTIYRRGDGSLRPDAPRDVHSVQTWPQPRVSNNGGKLHSGKPDGLLDLVEEGFQGPYAELFARRARFNWAYPIGDQSLERVVV